MAMVMAGQSGHKTILFLDNKNVLHHAYELSSMIGQDIFELL